MAKIPKKQDEIYITKAIMLELSNDIVMLVASQCHTEKLENGKANRAKSLYRVIARVMTKQDVKDQIREARKDENFNKRWRWPDDNLPYYVFTNKDAGCHVAAGWLETKMNKLMTWEKGLDKLNGYETKTPNRAGGFNKNAAYAIHGFKTDDGQTVDLDDRETLLKLVGKNLYHLGAHDSESATSKAAIIPTTAKLIA